MPQVPLWALEEVDGQAGILSLHRRYKTKNFVKALELMQRIGAVAEEEGHHPDLHLTGWNNLEVSIFTHAIGGLSENDFILVRLRAPISKASAARCALPAQREGRAARGAQRAAIGRAARVSREPRPARIARIAGAQPSR